MAGNSRVSYNLSLCGLSCVLLCATTSSHQYQNISIFDMAAQLWNRRTAAFRHILFNEGRLWNANSMESDLFNDHDPHLAPSAYCTIILKCRLIHPLPKVKKSNYQQFNNIRSICINRRRFLSVLTDFRQLWYGKNVFSIDGCIDCFRYVPCCYLSFVWPGSNSQVSLAIKELLDAIETKSIFSLSFIQKEREPHSITIA